MRYDVTQIRQIPFEDIELSEDGADFYEMCTVIHAAALLPYYPEGIPDPFAACDPEGILHLWWDCEGWPLVVRLDSDLWTELHPET